MDLRLRFGEEYIKSSEHIFIMSLFTTILSGAIGGFLATSLGTIVVQRFNRPELEFDDGIIKKGSSPYEERAETAEYEVQMQQLQNRL
jgi:hypothetical protein